MNIFFLFVRLNYTRGRDLFIFLYGYSCSSSSPFSDLLLSSKEPLLFPSDFSASGDARIPLLLPYKLIANSFR